MRIPFFQVDAFTNRLFGGNPAAICLLEGWLEDTLLQQIATENNLSETAFLVPLASGSYALKWFTPRVEIDLCGHATLASAFVLFNYFDQDKTSLRFATASGELVVEKLDKLLAMQFPARPPTAIKIPALLSQALGATPSHVLEARDLLAIFEDEKTIEGISPDFATMKKITSHFGIIVSAPGMQTDFVSRFFAPNAGVNEDPVTGSSHCTLIPYWAQRLQKTRLHAVQLSSRRGELVCGDAGDRVTIAGEAVLFARGEIVI